MARIPDSIDKYKLEELVASGGMGRVYRGVHPTLDRQVIIKKLTLRGEASYAERFRREASILMDFRSDYVVDVYDHFRKASNHYIVMEYVDGCSVQDLLQRERYLDGATSAWIVLCTARALVYAHSKNVVHRDIKPANVLVSKEGDVKLVDFGIATSRENDSDLTSEGMTLGTPSYMAPEQFADSRTVDGRADFYSLGVMLYELLTGRKPFPGRFSPELIRTIESGRYKKPRKVNPSAPRELVSIIRSVMRPNPKRRKIAPEQFISRLERYLSRFEIAGVKERLAAIVGGTELSPLVRVHGSRRAFRVAAIVLVTLFAASLAGWSAITGLHRRVIAPSDYGQIRFTIEGFPGEVERTAVAISVEPDVAARGTGIGGALPNGVGESRRARTVVRTAPVFARAPGDPTSVILTTLPLVLEAGDYRVTAEIGDRQVSSWVPLLSWSERPGEQVVRLPLVDAAARPLRVEAIITDAARGEDLSQIARVEVLRDNRYLPLSVAGELISGRVHTFRIRAPGYETETLVVESARSTGSLALQVSLRQAGGSR